MSLQNLLPLILAMSSSIALTQTSQWPAGLDVCQGSWTYNEYDSCESPDHGPDKNRPIFSQGGVCGYGSKAKSCFHGDEFSRVVDTPIVEIRRNDTGWESAEVQNICNAQSTTIPLNTQERIAGITIGHIEQGQECRRRDWKKKCQAWTKKLYYSCHYEIHTKVNRANADACGTEVDLDAPHTCVTGYANIVKRGVSCQTFKTLTTPPLTSASALRADSWRFGFSCSTGDDLPDGTLPDARQKYSTLLDLLAAAKGQADENIILKNLEALLAGRESLLDDGQKENIRRILDKAIVDQEAKTGGIFDANVDCALKNDGSRWFCRTKKISLGLKETSHLHSLASQTSIRQMLGYIYQCQVRSGSMSVRTTLNSSSILISPTSDQNEQLIEVPFSPKDGLATIDFTPDANFTADEDCTFKITVNEIDVDEELLKNSIRIQLSQYAQMQKIFERIEAAKQLPEKFSTIDALKDDLNMRIIEGTLSCRTIASTMGKKDDDFCPNPDDAKAFCEQKTVMVDPEIQVIIDGIRKNACLLKDLDEALPDMSLCKDSASQCLDEISQVSESIAQALRTSKIELEKVSDALKSEMTRIEKTSIDAFENIKRIQSDIEAMIAATKT